MSKDAIAESQPSSTHEVESSQVALGGVKLATCSSHRWAASSTLRKRASYWLRAEGLAAKAVEQKAERRAAVAVERRADRQAAEAVKR